MMNETDMSTWAKIEKIIHDYHRIARGLKIKRLRKRALVLSST